MGRQTHRSLRTAVVAVAEADDVGVAGEFAGRKDGDLVGLAAGVREIADRQVAARRYLFRQLLAEQADRGVQVDRGNVLEFADLLLDFLDDLRMAVTYR